MKDEIKEILDKLIETSCANGVFLTTNTRDKIIDYITTLQEENERLNNIIKEIRELADKYEMGKYDYNVPSFEIKEILDKENK